MTLVVAAVNKALVLCTTYLGRFLLAFVGFFDHTADLDQQSKATDNHINFYWL